MPFTINPGTPPDYHCSCEYCVKFKGTILDENRNVINCRRRVGYHWLERSHIAKTPFPIAAWAVEEFTEEGDWVVDPTVGVGTTLVESKKRGRNAVGIELNHEWARIAALSCQHHAGKHLVIGGDARDWKRLLDIDYPFKLLVNNPPYSGDENQVVQSDEDGYIVDRKSNMYEKDKRNIAFMKEGPKYYKLWAEIYNGIGELYMIPGGHLVIGVKDMVRNKAPYLLHRFLARTIDVNIWEFVGTWILPHYPRTLFMNTYPKRFPEVRIPLYQTILVWRRR